eukprot:813165-Rhodomonas_salina.1
MWEGVHADEGFCNVNGSQSYCFTCGTIFSKGKLTGIKICKQLCSPHHVAARALRRVKVGARSKRLGTLILPGTEPGCKCAKILATRHNNRHRLNWNSPTSVDRLPSDCSKCKIYGWTPSRTSEGSFLFHCHYHGSMAYCQFCAVYYSASSGKRTSVVRHCKSKRHIRALQNDSSKWAQPKYQTTALGQAAEPLPPP